MGKLFSQQFKIGSQFQNTFYCLTCELKKKKKKLLGNKSGQLTRQSRKKENLKIQVETSLANFINANCSFKSVNCLLFYFDYLFRLVPELASFDEYPCSYKN